MADYRQHKLMALQDLIKGGAEEGARGAQIAQQGDETRRTKEESFSRGQKMLQDATGEDTPQAGLQALIKGGNSVQVGDDSAHIGSGLGMAKQAAGEAKNLSSSYEKLVQPHHTKLASIEAGVNGLSQGSNIGDSIASINTARFAEGQGQRLLQSVIDKFKGTSAPSSATGFMNWLSGQNTSTFTPEQRKGVADIFKTQYDTTKQDLQSAEQKFRQTAPAQAPIMHSQGQLDPYLNHFGTQSADRMGRIESQLGSFYQNKNPSAPAPAPVAQQAPQKSVVTSIKDLISGAFGNKTPQAPQGAPMMAAPSQAPAPQGMPGSAPPAQSNGLSAEERAEMDRLRKELGR